MHIGLTVQIDHVESIEIGKVKTPDAKARQRQRMGPSDAAQPGDGDSFLAKFLLLPFRDPANISAERSGIVESTAHRCQSVPVGTMYLHDHHRYLETKGVLKNGLSITL